MAAELDFASNELGGILDTFVNSIKTGPEIAGKRGEYAQSVVVNAFSVWKQALAHLQSGAAADTTETARATVINLFETKPSEIRYTPRDSDEANTAIQNASLLIKKILGDDVLARWIANALSRRANQTPAAAIGAELRTAIGDLTTYIKTNRRASLDD